MSVLSRRFRSCPSLSGSVRLFNCIPRATSVSVVDTPSVLVTISQACEHHSACDRLPHTFKGSRRHASKHCDKGAPAALLTNPEHVSGFQRGIERQPHATARQSHAISGAVLGQTIFVEVCFFVKMWFAQSSDVVHETDFEKGTALGDAVYRYAEEWISRRGTLTIKREIENFMTARSTGAARDSLEHSVSTLQDGLEKMSSKFQTECASLTDGVTNLTQALSVHDKFRAVATARLKYLEQDVGGLSHKIDGWPERLKLLEDKAEQLETQEGKLEEQAGQLESQAKQLEEMNRDVKQLLASSEKRDAAWNTLKYVIAGDLYKLAEGTVGSVDDLQTNLWLRQPGDEGRSDMLPLQKAFCVMGTECEYVLKESLWDASIYMMCPFFPSQEMSLMIVAFLLNAVLQGTLCSIVVYLGRETTDYSDSVLDDWATWAEEVSAVERQVLCSGSSYLSTSALQWISIDAIQEYNSSVLGDLGRGQMLCVVVVTVWCAICTIWLRDLGDLFVALVGHTDWSSTASLCITHEIRNFRIHSISRGRLAWMSLVIVPQIWVLFVLSVWGSNWLIATSEVSDLLLNAVALGFITDTDEILFKLCVPTRIQIVTSRTEPLRVCSLKRIVPIRSLVSILSVVLFVSVATFVFIKDEDDRRSRGLSILCP